MNSAIRDMEYLKSLSILYVEDEADVREQFSQFLQRLAGKLITAENGADGLAAYNEHKPDIIITDIRMPVMDGLSMAGEIRNSDKTVRIVVLTAFEETNYLKQAINIGIDKYVTKPVIGLELQEAVLEQAQNLRIEAELKQARELLQNERKLLSDIVEATRAGMGDDLDSMLVCLFAALETIPSFYIKPKGVIRLYNSRLKLVTIARIGFQPFWLDPLTDSLFAALPQVPFSEAFVADLTTRERALVLPLTNGEQQLGQMIILMAQDWTPAADRMEFMTILAQRLSRLVNRCLNHEILQIREVEIEEARIEALKRLEAASEFRDNETGMHIMRMTNIALAIARAMGLDENQQALLCITAPMHDVGKIGIPDSILLKPGKLTDDEFSVMKGHTEIGERLLQGSNDIFEAARDIALSHHENWDGSGYPRGLKGDQIPLLAQICALADVFDALTSKRPYKEAWLVEDTVAWIRRKAGKKFDPAAVKAFEKVLPEISRIRELYREDIINPNQILHLAKPVYADNRWVNWDESLAVGIDVIDEHHRYLFDLINDLINVVANKLSARELMRVLNALVHYVQVHFQAEERMMEYYSYDGIAVQKQQHKHFQDKLKEFFVELHLSPLIVKNEVAPYLQKWLVEHIRNEDTQLRELVA